MQATFYSFSKRSNSTKQPTGTSTTLEIKLKSNCSKESPVFQLVGFDTTWNYFEWLNSYYFINDVIYVTNDIVEIHASMDSLATYKSDIGDYTAYVERSASSYNTNLFDSMVRMSEQASVFAKDWAQLSWFNSTGCYLLRVQGRQTALSESGLTTFVLSKSELTALMGVCFAPAGTSIFDDIIDNEDFESETTSQSGELNNALARAIFNPAKYIVSCMWLPLSKTELAGAGQNIFLGWYDTGLNGQVLAHKGLTTGTTIPVPANTYNDFRDITEPWTTYTLYLGGVGAIPISAKDVVVGMEAVYCIDFLTGVTQICVNTQGGKLIGSYTCNLGVSIPIAGLIDNFSGAVTSIASAIGYGVAGNVSGAVASAVSGATAMMQPTPSIIGTQGTLSSILSFPYVWLNKRVMGTTDFPTSEMGRPLCKNVKINTLSGFVKCGNASISLNATESERERVNTLLNNGFYYE